MTVYKHGHSKYLLDINPHYVQRNGSTDAENIVDGRWIDMINGLYIDVTAVTDGAAHGLGPTPVRKDGHAYSRHAVYPLQESTLQDAKAHVPHTAEAVLVQEFGEDALYKKVLRGYG